MTTSPWRISCAVGSLASVASSRRPIAIRIRASISAGPAVSRMTSSTPHSDVNALRPPSVVIAITGALTPVDVSNFEKLLAFGRSVRASIKTQSITGASINTDASMGRILIVCCNSPSAGRTCALAPVEFVNSNTFAISHRPHVVSLNWPTCSK